MAAALQSERIGWSRSRSRAADRIADRDILQAVALRRSGQPASGCRQCMARTGSTLMLQPETATVKPGSNPIPSNKIAAPLTGIRPGVTVFP